MPIWKLSAMDRNNRNWEGSTFFEEIIVRAESEGRARKFVGGKLRKGATKQPGDEGQIDPWGQSSALVTAVEVKDHSYPTTGKEEILDPEEARWHNDA